MGFSWPNRVSLIHCKCFKAKVCYNTVSHSPCRLCLFEHPGQPNTTMSWAEPTSWVYSTNSRYWECSRNLFKNHFLSSNQAAFFWPVLVTNLSMSEICVWNFFALMENSRLCGFLLEWLDFIELIHNWFSACFACVDKKNMLFLHTQTHF